MPWKRLRRLRLSQALLLLLVPALAGLSLLALQVTARDAQRAADAAYDRSLLGALKSIDANVSTESGGLSVELPYRLFEFFELTASGPVFYRVATADGLVELGSTDLPAPPRPLQPRVPQFYDGVYSGEPVRLVAWMRELDKPALDTPSSGLVIQVAESTQSRGEFKRVVLRRAVLSNAVYALLTVGVALGALVFVLRPLAAVSREIDRRSGTEVAPLPVADLPADLRPLVDAINQHMARVDELGRQQRAFLDDASHQLRTHLTTLRMQVDYARIESDPNQVRAAVAAIAAELQRAARSTQQLLSLARSDAATLQAAPFDARELLQDVAREFFAAARAKGLDLGVEGEALPAWGDAGLLREALANLVANAIAYVPAGSVTLRAAADALGFSLSVEDAGPGLPHNLQAAAGTRFLRAPGAGAQGSGLGLAIARSIAARHGGVLRLEPPERGSGLRATVWWPRAGSAG